MKKKIIILVGLLAAASAALAAAPKISLTTIWQDTSYTGPYVIRTVVKCSDPMTVYLA